MLLVSVGLIANLSIIIYIFLTDLSLLRKPCLIKKAVRNHGSAEIQSKSAIPLGTNIVHHRKGVKSEKFTKSENTTGLKKNESKLKNSAQRPKSGVNPVNIVLKKKNVDDEKPVKAPSKPTVVDTGIEKKKKIQFNKAMGEQKIVNCKVENEEYHESLTFLTLAKQEQKEVIDLMKKKQEELKKKLYLKNSKRKRKEDSEKSVSSKISQEDIIEENLQISSHLKSYSNTLDEIMQTWINLFYFIINLRINLLKTLSSCSKEPLIQNENIEKFIVIQAIECVSFFSKLKIKSLTDFFENFSFDQETEKYECDVLKQQEKLLSLFISEIELMENKAVEIMKKIKLEGKK